PAPVLSAARGSWSSAARARTPCPRRRVLPFRAGVLLLGAGTPLPAAASRGMSLMIERSAPLLLLLTIVPAGAWDRIIWTGQGRSVDVPAPHPLSWFERRAPGADVHRPGALAGFPIICLDNRSPRRKSILVKSGAGRYVEIYHLEADYVVTELTPVRIVQTPDEPV